METDYRAKALEIIKNKTSFVVNGGGVLGASVISGIEYLKELGGYDQINDVTGSSIGSIISTTIACRASIEYMKETLYNLDFTKFQDKKCIIRDIYQLIRFYGLNSVEPIRKFTGKILEDLVQNENITFLELFNKTGIKLTITYLSLKKGTMYANYLTEPNSSVREAMVKSSTIPLFYEAYLEKDKRKIQDVIMDGGTLNNYPMNFPRSEGVEPNKILGFKFISDDEDPITGDIRLESELPKNIFGIFTYLIELIRQQALKIHVHKDDWKLSVKIHVGELKSTDFNMTEEQKEWLFKQGRIAVENYIDELADLLEKGEYPY